MLTLTHIREDRDQIILALSKRGIDATESIDKIIALDQERRSLQKELDDTLAKSNSLSRQIGELMKAGKRDEAEGVKTETSGLKQKSSELKEQMQGHEASMNEILYTIPNTPADIVAAGKSEEDNEIISTHGEQVDLSDSCKSHWDIAKDKDIIDFDLGAKVTGAGFPFYKGKGAKLQRGLIRYFLEKADEAGYTEYIPPLMINSDSGFGTGQLPDKEGQMYHMQADDLYMIPTAEVPLTNIYRDTLVTAADLPIKLCGYTPCFRREAGSYGKDVRGLNRLHQFDKVEIVQIAEPGTSDAALEGMVAHVQSLLEGLELPYRILRLCAGDMGFTAAITYDFEVWSAAQGRWLEVSSVSNFETFQANRLKCRYKDSEGSNKLVHTLNGSALALPRIVAALLENHQSEGDVNIPSALVPFVGFDKI
jgi:seryl-tRNA synthetase